MPKKTQIITDKPKEEKSSKAKKKSTATPKNNQVKVKNDDFFQMVEKRAYELFVERGCTHGMAENDWYQAEKEIMKNANL